MYKFQNKNISNILTNEILKFLKNFNEYQYILDVNKINKIQGKFKNLLKDMKIEFNIFCSKDDYSQLIKGYYDNIKNKIVLNMNKKDVDNFRQKFLENKHHLKQINFDSLEYIRREILLFFEHELTHKIQFKKIPKSFGLIYYKNYADDYREIEAVTNEIIKLKNDYRIPLIDSIHHSLNKRNINRKKVLKKVFKKGF